MKILGLIIIGGLLSLWFFYSQKPTKIILPNGQIIKVEVSRSEREITLGLSGRKTLTADQGMLFIFPHKKIYSFWMKEMNFSLDFVWLDDQTVVDLTENVLPPDKNNQDNLVIYQPKQPVNRVLELKAGSINQSGLKIGDSID